MKICTSCPQQVLASLPGSFFVTVVLKCCSNDFINLFLITMILLSIRSLMQVYRNDSYFKLRPFIKKHEFKNC
jgi:hypothetical protein